MQTHSQSRLKVSKVSSLFNYVKKGVLTGFSVTCHVKVVRPFPTNFSWLQSHCSLVSFRHLQNAIENSEKLGQSTAI